MQRDVFLFYWSKHNNILFRTRNGIDYQVVESVDPVEVLPVIDGSVVPEPDPSEMYVMLFFLCPVLGVFKRLYTFT